MLTSHKDDDDDSDSDGSDDGDGGHDGDDGYDSDDDDTEHKAERCCLSPLSQMSNG